VIQSTLVPRSIAHRPPGRDTGADGDKVRLYFDFGVVFWRPSEDGPVSFVAEELDASFRADDIGTRFGVVGLQLEAVRYDALDDGSRVTLQFDRRQVSFECRNDVTTYSA
jgi:hypothetical protein